MHFFKMKHRECLAMSTKSFKVFVYKFRPIFETQSRLWHVNDVVAPKNGGGLNKNSYELPVKTRIPV